MRLIAIVLCALSLAASDARADILELLKTHKIVIGKGCSEKGGKPCVLPAMSPVSEIRMANEFIATVSLIDKTGFIYPVDREEDVTSHPLMAGYFQRQSQKNYYFKTRATVTAKTLTLSVKNAFGNSPRDPIHQVTEERIEVSGNTCTATYAVTGKSKSYSYGNKFRNPCEIVPLAEPAAATTEAPKWRTLSFAKIKDSAIGRATESFSLVKDHLFYNKVPCSDGSALAIEFDWRGGSLKGDHECQYVNGHARLTYVSNVKIDGDRRELIATGAWETRGRASNRIPLEFDIQINLEGGKCRIEKFYSLQATDRRMAALADAQSACYLE